MIPKHAHLGKLDKDLSIFLTNFSLEGLGETVSICHFDDQKHGPSLELRKQ